MGSIAIVSQEGTAHLIRQAYEAGEKFQWVREALVNGIQAEATNIDFGIEPQGFKSRRVLRRYIADNGVRMSPDNIRIFLMSFGGGGRPIGLTQNFGQGFKSSCYEWNPYGIVVASWTRDDPEGSMIWIHQVVRAGKIYWELKDFTLDDGSQEDVVAPFYVEDIGVDVAKLKTKAIEGGGQGTVFLFLGKAPDDDTHNGDVDRGEHHVKRGIINFINTRFLEIPEGVIVRVAEVEERTRPDRESWQKDYLESPSGTVLALDWRRAKGVKAFIPDSAQYGRFKLKHDTWVDWHLAGEDVIRVFPGSSRGQLLSKGGTPLPWAEWEDSFAVNMPKQVKDALDEFRKSRQSPVDSGQRRERLRRIAARLGTRFRPINLIESYLGRVAGNDSMSRTGEPRVHVKPKRSYRSGQPGRQPSNSADTGGTGNTAILIEDRSGDRFGSARRSSYGIPETVWDAHFPDDAAAYAARFDKVDIRDGSFGTVHFNLSFPLFQSEFRYWTDQYPKAAAAEVEELVRSVYEDEVISKILHAHKMSGQVLYSEDGEPARVNNSNIGSWISPEALTTAALGLINVEQRINVLAGSRFGKKKSV